jgi:hypothetical protein
LAKALPLTKALEILRDPETSTQGLMGGHCRTVGRPDLGGASYAQVLCGFGDKIRRNDIMIGGRSKRVLSTFSGPS